MILDGLLTLLTPVVAGALYEGNLPRGYTLPAVAFHSAGLDVNYGLSGTSGYKRRTVQFDVYADTPEAARQDEQALQQFLDDFKGTLADGTTVLGTFLGTAIDLGLEPQINRTALAYRVMFHVEFVYTGTDY